MENYTITISVEGDYFGFKIQDDSDNVVNWDELSREEQRDTTKTEKPKKLIVIIGGKKILK